MAADGAPTRTREPRAERPKKKGKFGLILLLFLAAPAAAAGWFFLQTPERQQEIQDKMPPGWEDRGIQALIVIGALFVLAKVVLPILHGAGTTLGTWLRALRAKPTWLRILLFPVELIVWLLYTIARLGFAADAVLIIALCILSLLAVVRIMKPEFLVEYIPEALQK